MTAAPQSTPQARRSPRRRRRRRLRSFPALRNALAAALVAFGLCFPIISYHAESNINNELVLIGRWPLSFGIAAIVFLFVLFRQVSPPDWRIWFDRVGAVAAGGMGGALAESAAEGGGGRAAVARPRRLLQVVRAVRARVRDPVSVHHAGAARVGRLAEMDQQLRRPDHDLRDAGLGAEHRGRARGPARPRLCRFLRRRRLFLCAALDHLRPVVLDLPAARRLARRDVGRHPRLSGAAAARRLSGDRDAGLRRNHPAGADQLGRLHQWLRGHLGNPARQLFRHSVQRRGQRIRGDLPSAVHADLPHDVPVLPHPGARSAHELRHAEASPAADRPRLGGVARRRDRLSLAGHQHHQHQTHRLCARRDVRGLRRLVLRSAPGLRQPGKLHLHGVGDHSRHRGARRHGLAARRRDRGGGDDRRARADARTRLDEADFRRRTSIRPSTECCCSAPRWCS